MPFFYSDPAKRHEWRFRMNPSYNEPPKSKCESEMIETVIVSLTMFFATLGPLDAAAAFAALTANMNPKMQKSVAFRGVAVAGFILLGFALAGEVVLHHLGISLAALSTSGGILLLLIGIDLVFARSSGGITTTKEEADEARSRADIAIFPIATPMLAGPGAMGTAILQMANTGGDWLLQLMVLSALGGVLLLTLALFLLSSQINRTLGITGMHVISRVFGVLLCALAVQFIFDGIAHSELFLRLVTSH